VYTVELRAFGLHNARNAAAALGVAEALEIPLDPVLDRLAQVEPVGDRGRVFRCGEHLVVADCYNANPSSMRAALSSFVALRACCDGPLVAVLGDMLEMGNASAQFHQDLGGEVADHGIDCLVGVGAKAVHAVSTAKTRGVTARGFDPSDVDAIVGAILDGLTSDAGGTGAVLFKASRGIRLERVVEQLRRALEG
jgi:UDP-N-acetylmuramoyl-tripeptide--D-alanyl-D-alanine ligase